MARHLSVASVIDKNKLTSDNAWVALLEVRVTDPNTRDVVDTIRIARNSENVIFGVDEGGAPRVFQAANFEITIEQSKDQAPTCSVSAQDQTGFIQARMEAMAGGVFSEVVMTVVNTDRLDQPPEIEETFQVVTSGIKDYVVTFQLGAENPLGIQFPRSRQWKDRCVWRFRGYGCRYAGAVQTCDYTKDGPNGCQQKFNTINFKGLPGLVRMNL